ncbi:glycosyltransferase family 4 protein [Alkaliphilus pronyensis]|uniref:Glycosyltransferase family 4 protein n=1 Tax=Alkaliphilus pronyensis TaxID=1482732 RepID=A0A6I0FLD2_9FIRM|nr:glycosyltransferase family 4 protein [Alkaliphilus pronyensis]KAB3537314.1 glycosyltransferase family 4 protein [Alkaliphilus pronyensis]
MRVFHGIIEIAGQMGILCGALKRKGHIAVGYNTFQSYLDYKEHLINTDAFEIRKMLKQIVNFFDIFHFHYGATIMPNFEDLEIIKNKKKKIIMHHWGNEIRFHDLAMLNNPYVYTGDSPPNNDIHQKLLSITKYIDEAIVQDYEVLPHVANYYKKVHIMPIAIDIRKFKPHYPSRETKKPLILHAPTNPDFKGTAYIEKAIEELRHTHLFDYKRIEKMSNAHVVEMYKEADIIVDQVCCGSYGLLSVESMALGKPVIVYIREDLKDSFPSGLPVVNGNPDNIKQAIKDLIESPERRHELGVKGREFAKKYHSSNVVVERLLNIYSKLS